MEHPERTLLEGEHTRSIAKPTPSTGGLMKFAQVTLQCLKCKAKLPPNSASRALCAACSDNVRVRHVHWPLVRVLAH